MQNREKQIEEMAKDIGDSISFDYFDFVMHDKTAIIAKRAAEKLTAKGYRKQSEGEWIIKGDYLKIMECSACGMMSASIHEKTRFCPNCGARMKGGAE